jgi:hypothetical protein
MGVMLGARDHKFWAVDESMRWYWLEVHSLGSVIGEGRDGWQPLPSCIPRADAPKAAVGEVGVSVW